MEQTTTAWIAGQVRAILAQRRLTGRWLAEQMGMPPTTFSRRLNGVLPFTVDELTAVARVLGVPATSFFPAEDRQAVPAGHVSAEVA